jgi:hypothetical protein
LISPLLRRPLPWLVVLASLELTLSILSILSFSALAHANDVME